MDSKNEEEVLDSKELLEEKVEETKEEDTTKVVSEKYTRPPAFQSQHNIWRWNFQNNNNNRQPIRKSAWRGR